MSHAALRLTTALASALAASIAAAQTPPIKPGLWEIRSERQIDGNAATAPTDAMKNMKPEARARVEAMMKQKGVAVGSGGANRVCFTKDTLDAGRWQNSTSCKTDYGARTASTWKWRSVCESSGTSVEGEALFANPENYTVSTTSKHAFRGETKTTVTTIKAHWLGADCGDLKPIEPRH